MYDILYLAKNWLNMFVMTFYSHMFVIINKKLVRNYSVWRIIFGIIGKKNTVWYVWTVLSEFLRFFGVIIFVSTEKLSKSKNVTHKIPIKFDLIPAKGEHVEVTALLFI